MLHRIFHRRRIQNDKRCKRLVYVRTSGTFLQSVYPSDSSHVYVQLVTQKKFRSFFNIKQQEKETKSIPLKHLRLLWFLHFSSCRRSHRIFWEGILDLILTFFRFVCHLSRKSSFEILPRQYDTSGISPHHRNRKLHRLSTFNYIDFHKMFLGERCAEYFAKEF